MLDIVEIEDNKDLGVAVSSVTKAANVVSIQLGDLDYALNFGVDLRYFISNPAQFQNDSFKAYLVQRLTESQINVAQVIETIEALLTKYTFAVGDENDKVKGFIR